MFKKHVYNHISCQIELKNCQELAKIRGVLVWQGI